MSVNEQLLCYWRFTANNTKPTQTFHISLLKSIILSHGGCRLVALSHVPKTTDAVQNFLLQLPTESLSLLNVQLHFVFKKDS